MSIFEKIEHERGMVARIYSDFGAFPESVEAHFPLNKALMLSENAPLPRAERELLAFITSEHNKNVYCATHHRKAFENLSSEGNKERNSLLEQLAITLTLFPKEAFALKSKFHNASFSDAQWQHAVNIVAYFNYTNRLAFSMNMELENGYEKSYN